MPTTKAQFEARLRDIYAIVGPEEKATNDEDHAATKRALRASSYRRPVMERETDPNADEDVGQIGSVHYIVIDEGGPREDTIWHGQVAKKALRPERNRKFGEHAAVWFGANKPDGVLKFAVGDIDSEDDWAVVDVWETDPADANAVRRGRFLVWRTDGAMDSKRISE
ncbi:MAG: hypothetical protein MI755_16420 [Sphingomonadales bacterium]|nr:hypothetical protein [Sphingomonadales bacterium]